MHWSAFVLLSTATGCSHPLPTGPLDAWDPGSDWGPGCRDGAFLCGDIDSPEATGERDPCPEFWAGLDIHGPGWQRLPTLTSETFEAARTVNPPDYWAVESVARTFEEEGSEYVEVTEMGSVGLRCAGATDVTECEEAVESLPRATGFRESAGGGVFDSWDSHHVIVWTRASEVGEWTTEAEVAEHIGRIDGSEDLAFWVFASEPLHWGGREHRWSSSETQREGGFKTLGESSWLVLAFRTSGFGRDRVLLRVEEDRTTTTLRTAIDDPACGVDE